MEQCYCSWKLKKEITTKLKFEGAKDFVNNENNDKCYENFSNSGNGISKN